MKNDTFPEYTVVRIVQVGFCYGLVDVSSGQFADELFNTHHDAHLFSIVMNWLIEE